MDRTAAERMRRMRRRRKEAGVGSAKACAKAMAETAGFDEEAIRKVHVQFRLAQHYLREVRQSAEQEGVTVTEWVRDAIIERLAREKAESVKTGKPGRPRKVESNWNIDVPTRPDPEARPVLFSAGSAGDANRRNGSMRTILNRYEGWTFAPKPAEFGF